MRVFSLDVFSNEIVHLNFNPKYNSLYLNTIVGVRTFNSLWSDFKHLAIYVATSFKFSMLVDKQHSELGLRQNMVSLSFNSVIVKVSN